MSDTKIEPLTASEMLSVIKVGNKINEIIEALNNHYHDLDTFYKITAKVHYKDMGF